MANIAILALKPKLLNPLVENRFDQNLK